MKLSIYLDDETTLLFDALWPDYDNASKLFQEALRELGKKKGYIVEPARVVKKT